MKLIHITGVIQTAPHNGVCDMFKMCIECCYIHIGHVFQSSENAFSI